MEAVCFFYRICGFSVIVFMYFLLWKQLVYVFSVQRNLMNKGGEVPLQSGDWLIERVIPQIH